MKDIVSLAGYAGKVLCLVVFVGLAQTCGLSAFAAMSADFMAGFGVTPGDARAAKAKNVLTADPDARALP